MILQSAHRHNRHRPGTACIHFGWILREYLRAPDRPRIDVGVVREADFFRHLVDDILINGRKSSGIRLRAARSLIAHDQRTRRKPFAFGFQGGRDDPFQRPVGIHRNADRKRDGDDQAQ
ncbi:hypothetical protein D3C81_1556270 [compost metagenome]